MFVKMSEKRNKLAKGKRGGNFFFQSFFLSFLISMLKHLKVVIRHRDETHKKKTDTFNYLRLPILKAIFPPTSLAWAKYGTRRLHTRACLLASAYATFLATDGLSLLLRLIAVCFILPWRKARCCVGTKNYVCLQTGNG